MTKLEDILNNSNFHNGFDFDDFSNLGKYGFEEKNTQNMDLILI